MSAQASAGTDLVYVSDLFERFTDICGSCHGPAVDPPGLGGFQIQSSADFSTAMTAAVLGHVESNETATSSEPAQDPTDPMPPPSSPNGGPFDKRSATDPVREFADLVSEWLAAGSPQSFSPTSSSPDGGPAGDGGEDAGMSPSPYQMSLLAGDTMTNLGYCIPDRALVGVEQVKGKQLDAMFAGLSVAAAGSGVTPAQLIGLPEDLANTDLFTFDTATLAQYGVVAFQPAYPLWSDNAGKLRYVRVPVGTSIKFNKDTQEFTIPPNTRFYKTFMKLIVDTDGSYRYRKIETRLILSRPDQLNSDGTSTPTALFGTYQWNEDETDATLIETPLRDGLPFADTLIQYTTDEQLSAEILAGKPLLPLEALLEGGAARHYAIPSSQRCIECHMGSNSASFVLGFRPVQIARRSAGEGGILTEPGQTIPGPDELTQLQRLIDYGVITGIDSADDILPLEQAEGSRAPRNSYELTAQGYMVGNCAHCHNPRGYPSVLNPVLANILDFLPGPSGGIFQFPLERYSPRIGRGPGQGELIPYITPSLMDQPSAFWNAPEGGDDQWNTEIASASGSGVDYIQYAPWRSLIFRNVDTPFSYSDNLALFPHMPMNTPGYDCRAKQVMSDWMVSIPAVRKNPERPEYAFENGAGPPITGGSTLDDNAQPYVEVPPGTPQYDAAELAAQTRLSVLHTGMNPAVPATNAYSVYTYCPDTSDILDPAVVLDPICHPVPIPDDSTPLSSVTPARAHWVNTDLTQPPNAPGTFSVRRPDWPQVVAQQVFPAPVAQCGGSLQDAVAAQDEVEKTVSLLQNVYLDDANDGFRTFATTPVPFGLWEQKPGCNFSSVPTAGTFSGASRPQWMAHVSPSPSAPVYMASPGAAVFGMICINCHGPNANAQGRLSDNLATMTGGNAIVADFLDGLFGPENAPGLHRQEAFATSVLPAGLGANWTNTTVDDRVARYMSWMALGGTEVQIPLSILNIVADTRVLGVPRTLPVGTISANMLSAAKAICLGLLVSPLGEAITLDPTAGWFQPDATDPDLKGFPLMIATNGDAELWLQLCSWNNPPPVRAIYPYKVDAPAARAGLVGSGYALNGIGATYYSMIDQSAYGSGRPVGNQSGGVDPGLAPSNLYPWCYTPPDPTDPNQVAFVQQNASLPLCPFSAGAADACGTNCISADRADQWAIRGAINAGLAVYTYVDALVRNLSNGVPPQPTYDECNEIPGSPSP